MPNVNFNRTAKDYTRANDGDITTENHNYTSASGVITGIIERFIPNTNFLTLGSDIAMEIDHLKIKKGTSHFDITIPLELLKEHFLLADKADKIEHKNIKISEGRDNQMDVFLECEGVGECNIPAAISVIRKQLRNLKHNDGKHEVQYSNIEKAMLKEIYKIHCSECNYYQCASIIIHQASRKR